MNFCPRSVAGITHPGGNLTVVSLFTSSSNALIAKRVELLHEVVPKVTTFGWLVDANILDYDDQQHELENAAKAFDLKLAVARVDGQSDLESTVASLIVTDPAPSSRVAPSFTKIVRESLPPLRARRCRRSTNGAPSSTKAV